MTSIVWRYNFLKLDKLLFENFEFKKRKIIFDGLQQSVTCFTKFAETRTYLPSPNFLMTYFEAKYHAMIVETQKNEAMKGKQSSQHLEVRKSCKKKT